MTLNGGRDPETGIRIFKSEGDLYSFKSASEIFEAFKKQLHKYMELQVITEHISDEYHRMIDPNAFRSSLVHDCIERTNAN